MNRNSKGSFGVMAVSSEAKKSRIVIIVKYFRNFKFVKYFRICLIFFAVLRLCSLFWSTCNLKSIKTGRIIFLMNSNSIKLE